MFLKKYLLLVLFLWLGWTVGLSQSNTTIKSIQTTESIEQQELVAKKPSPSPFRYTPQELNHRLIFMVAIFLTAALFFLIFYFGFSQKAAFLWLSLYCTTHSFKAIFKPDQSFFSPEFLEPYQTLDHLHFIVTLGGIFLIAFMLWEMNVPHKWKNLLAFTALSAISFFSISEPQFLIFSFITGFAIVLYGVYQKAEGRWWTLTGLMGLAFLTYLGNQDMLGFGYFIGIIFFIVCMTLSVGQQVAQQIRLRQAALLRSSTLENQLLKKSIQPHFIFNSLASLQELIDQNPDKASHFVEQLADEFRLLNNMSPQQLIPISDELKLCQAHLKIMEYRKNAQFSLQTLGLNGNEKIPPGIFHTLVENGITHGYGTKNCGHFLLKKEDHQKHIIYTFFNDSEAPTTDTHPQNGTGLKYVKARLQEAYSDDWQLESQAVEGGWEVKIFIKYSQS